MKHLEYLTFPHERDLYAESDLTLFKCAFKGDEDGESALKQAKNVRLESCVMDLRYPLWHCVGVDLFDCEMTEKCRAPLWYTSDVSVRDCDLRGVKALRECDGVSVTGTRIVSPEFGWRCRGVYMRECALESEYLFLGASGVRWDGVSFKGKYSFQYATDVVIENCTLDTKDAFWHARNVTVRDSVVNGEYLGWYSEGLTFVNCRLSGTQPLCCCRDLKLINCELADADLSFEYSDVEADIKGGIISVKNPRSGRVTADSIGEIILTADSVYPCDCRIEERNG